MRVYDDSNLHSLNDRKREIRNFHNFFFSIDDDSCKKIELKISNMASNTFVQSLAFTETIIFGQGPVLSNLRTLFTNYRRKFSGEKQLTNFVNPQMVFPKKFANYIHNVYNIVSYQGKRQKIQTKMHDIKFIFRKIFLTHMDHMDDGEACWYFAGLNKTTMNDMRHLHNILKLKT